MKKRFLSILLSLCMVLMLFPVTAFAEGGAPETPVCTCKTACAADQMNAECAVCGAEGAAPQSCGKYEAPAEDSAKAPAEDSAKTSAEDSAKASAEAPVKSTAVQQAQALIDALPAAGDITAKNRSTVKAKLNDIDAAKATLTEAELAQLNSTRYDAAIAALNKLSGMGGAESPAPMDVQGSLAITISGFEVGKTLEDITYTFASTIPDVTFSTDDIQDVMWTKYDGGGSWSEVLSGQAFQADTSYQIILSLNDKGLSQPPDVTINGKTPGVCRLDDTNPWININCDLGTPAEPSNPALAITVNGFEVGNTPADCTFSFESTNLGVTFSADDIQDLTWWKFDENNPTKPMQSMSDTEVFTADTNYRIQFFLPLKSLTSAPTATVNGKKVQTCQIASALPDKLVVVHCFDRLTPTLKINGADEVCAQQDYEFTVTAAAGVTVGTQFTYGDTGNGALISKDGVLSGTVPAESYSDKDSFVLTVSGATTDGTPVSATKTVQISPDHIFDDGVCGCGAVQQYTITYDGGAEFGLYVDLKTHGQNLTLRSETFTREGYIQTGWVDEHWNKYELGGVYTVDEDMTFRPYWEKLVTLTVPYTTTVTLGNNGVPGETTFELALIDGCGDALTDDNVTVTAAVTTDGAGDYPSAMTITGPEQTLWRLLSENAFVRQVDAGEAGWTYDDTVYGLYLWGGTAYSNADNAAFVVLVMPASIDEFGNYEIDWDSIDWDSIDWEDPQSAEMLFTNTYTVHNHNYTQKYNENKHWDECGCGYKQNEEPHQYGEWTVTKEPTETEEGEQEHTCTVCGYQETEEIAKLSKPTDPTDPADPTEPTKTNKTTKTTKPTKATKRNSNTGATTSPQTGDNSMMGLWITLMLVSACGLFGIAVFAIKKRVE